jgi:hypothetical protein
VPFIAKVEEDSAEDKDFEFIVEALLFTKQNPYLLPQGDRERPLDLLKAEIELSKLKKRKKVFVGEVEEETHQQSPLEVFWKENVSSKHTVRWDLFEESIIEQFLKKIDINKGLARKINWSWFLRNLIKKLSNKSTEVVLVPGHPAMESKLFNGLVVNFKNFENFVNRGKLTKLFERAVGFDTYYLAEIFKKESYVYACGSEYKGNFRGFKRDGDGKLIMPDKSEYEGMFFNGTRHGYGTLVASGCCFKGYWENDTMNGLGQLICNNGSTVEGVWSRGSLRSGKLSFAGGEYSGFMNQYGFNGKGVFNSKNGEVKKGSWVIGKLEGPGEHIFPDGTKFIGTFKNDLLEGEGVIKTPFYVYKGSVSQSKPLGIGVMTFKDGAEYSGMFQNGNMNGKGTLNTQDYSLVGEFVEGKMSGKGEKHFKQIFHYFGEFYDSMMHGEGALDFKFDEFSGFFKGFFKLNEFYGYGELAVEGKIGKIEVVSTWAGEKINGNAEIRFPGMVFRGKISQNLPFYIGSIWLDDGGSYSGEWEHDKPHGKGEARDSLGNFCAGLFIGGKPTSKHKIDESFFINLDQFVDNMKVLNSVLLVLNKNIFHYTSCL